MSLSPNDGGKSICYEKPYADLDAKVTVVLIQLKVKQTL
jgi:hypothetical protein